MPTTPLPQSPSAPSDRPSQRRPWPRWTSCSGSSSQPWLLPAPQVSIIEPIGEHRIPQSTTFHTLPVVCLFRPSTLALSPHRTARRAHSPSPFGPSTRHLRGATDIHAGMPCTCPRSWSRVSHAHPRHDTTGLHGTEVPRNLWPPWPSHRHYTTLAFNNPKASPFLALAASGLSTYEAHHHPCLLCYWGKKPRGQTARPPRGSPSTVINAPPQ